jgi:hypothetical protein
MDLLCNLGTLTASIVDVEGSMFSVFWGGGVWTSAHKTFLKPALSPVSGAASGRQSIFFF